MNKNCVENGHDYTIARKGYYKQDGDRSPLLGTPTYDPSLSFAMLFCRRCGETKEIIWADQKKREPE